MDRSTVVRTALRVLDEVGLDGLTVRRLADELGVRAPALYWHVRDKRELLDAMADALHADAFADLELPRRGEPWVAWLAELARRLRGTALAHRDGAWLLAGRPLAGACDGRPLALATRTLVDAGFSAAQAGHALAALHAYVQGSALTEQADPEPPADDLADARFEHGLHLLLAGLRLSRLGA